MTAGIASFASAVVATAAATKVARSGIPGWDGGGFERINRLPDRLAPVVWAPMQVGALAAPLVVAGLLASAGDHRRAGRVAATGVASWVAAKQLKRLVGRPRPAHHIEHAAIRIGSADTGLGYPSGHAAVAVALVASATDPRSSLRWGLSALPLIVGFSRVYVGAHYPLDVIGGFALGAAIASAYRLAEVAAAQAG